MTGKRSTDVERALRDLAARRHGAFLRSDATAAAVGDRSLRLRLESGLLLEPAPGVLVHTAFPEGWKRELAVATLAGHGSSASHRAAIALHLDGVVDEPPVEVTVKRARRTSSPGAIVHRSSLLLPEDLTDVDAIPTTTLAVALASLGSVAPELVEPALDAARRSNVSLRWLRTVAEHLHRPGQRGPRMLLGLLDELAPGAKVRESWFEKQVEDVLRSPLLPTLVRQHDVRDRCGAVVARLDGAYPALKLGVEAHSRQFHFGSGPQAADERRDARLAAEGWQLLYLGWHRTRSHPDDVLRTVFAAAVARGWDPVTRTVRPPDRAA